MLAGVSCIGVASKVSLRKKQSKLHLAHPPVYARRQRRVRKQPTPSRLLGQIPRRARERIEVMARRLVPPVNDLIVRVTDLHIQPVVQQPWVLCKAAETLPRAWSTA